MTSHSSSHHHDDYALRFQRRSLRSIYFWRKVEKGVKILLFVIAVIMVVLVIIAYLFG